MSSLHRTASRPRDALHGILPQLYRFALVLAVNEELAKALLRGTHRALSARKDWRADNRDHVIEALRRMYALWSARVAEDANLQRRYPPEPRVFLGSLVNGALAGNAHFAKFIAALPFSQRAALYLVYGEGASYDEAAEVTALNMLALMKLLARGHVALSHWLSHRGISAEAGGAGNHDDRNGWAEDEPWPERERAA
jgi:RNA polymerase sigma-70 factor (ECF subfamily)